MSPSDTIWIGKRSQWNLANDFSFLLAKNLLNETYILSSNIWIDQLTNFHWVRIGTHLSSISGNPSHYPPSTSAYALTQNTFPNKRFHNNPPHTPGAPQNWLLANYFALRTFAGNECGLSIRRHHCLDSIAWLTNLKSLRPIIPLLFIIHFFSHFLTKP